MNNENSKELLKEVKSYLKITWNEEDTEIENLIKEGIQHLSEKIGAEIDFSKDLSALGLLKDYCRYKRNYSIEYFEQNFLESIVFLQFKYAREDLKDGES